MVRTEGVEPTVSARLITLSTLPLYLFGYVRIGDLYETRTRDLLAENQAS